MDKFNREVQRQLLKELYDAFPYGINPERKVYYSSAFGSENNLVANLMYLRAHSLIECTIDQLLSGKYMLTISAATITAKGIDFIRDDGGLSAILNVQTIRLHRESIAAIEDIIAVANIPEDQKQGLKAALQELPADAVKHLMNELVSKALAAAPAALPLIQKFLQGG